MRLSQSSQGQIWWLSAALDVTFPIPCLFAPRTRHLATLAASPLLARHSRLQPIAPSRPIFPPVALTLGILMTGLRRTREKDAKRNDPGLQASVTCCKTFKDVPPLGATPDSTPINWHYINCLEAFGIPINSPSALDIGAEELILSTGLHLQCDSLVWTQWNQCTHTDVSITLYKVIQSHWCHMSRLYVHLFIAHDIVRWYVARASACMINRSLVFDWNDDNEGI